VTKPVATATSTRPSSPRSSVRAISVEKDDPALIAAAQSGDRDALDALLRRHHDRIHALCRRVTANETDALDATQDALIAIVRGLPRYDGRASFTTWSYRVAMNACLDELRRRRRRPLVGLPDDDWMPAGVADDETDVATAVADRVTIDDAMAAVPLDFRAAVVLRDLCGLDYAEIAEVLSIPPGTVRSRIARGRAALADQLRGNPDTPGERQTPGA
jgi:RNA polymerase sigma-70 factor (ECF subfamily)